MTDRTSLERSPRRTLVRQSQGINTDSASCRHPSHSRPGISVKGYPGVAYHCDFEEGRLRQLSWDEQGLCNRRPRESEELATPTSEVKGSYRCALALKIETRLSQSSAVAVPQSETAHGHFRCSSAPSYREVPAGPYIGSPAFL